jgi:hypothetical protein
VVQSGHIPRASTLLASFPYAAIAGRLGYSVADVMFGRLFLPNLDFCARHDIGGIHTAKVGVNHRFF